jgi:D-alanyl-D-alanine carboxypeptidase/D-alanyl-D-alanine-endopeptidase (penicillin-binding protein 4)
VAALATKCEVARLIAAARLGGSVGFAVADAATGEVLEEADGAMRLPPASVAKTATSLYALDALGPDHRFQTRIIADGEMIDGILHGNLILTGGGDPTLLTDDLAKLAADMKAAGLREVQGGFMFWEGALPYRQAIDPGQLPHLGYNPAVSGFALNFNRVYFEWTRQGRDYGVSMDARSDLYRPPVTMARMRVVDRAGPVFSYADTGGVDDWAVAKRALGDDGSRWLPVRRPGLYAAQVFAVFARSQGIVLAEPEAAGRPPRGTLLALHRSQPLREVIRDMLLYSTNITAEMIGLTASAMRAGQGVPLAQSARMMTEWLLATYGIAGRFADHSGLGGASRMTARGMVRILAAPQAQAQLRPLLKEIAMRDPAGDVIKDHPAHVVAKTGTLNFVSALAGYETTRGGADLAFAIFAADADRREATADSQDEQPEGARTYNTRAKQLQQVLLQRWGNNFTA